MQLLRYFIEKNFSDQTRTILDRGIDFNGGIGIVFLKSNLCRKSVTSCLPCIRRTLVIC